MLGSWSLVYRVTKLLISGELSLVLHLCISDQIADKVYLLANFRFGNIVRLSLLEGISHARY